VSTIALSVAIAVVRSARSWRSRADLVIAGRRLGAGAVTFNVAVQMSAPRWVVARALSLYQMSTFAGIALGS
jgi:hypothetical protein